MKNNMWKVAALALVLAACKSTPTTPAKVEDTSAAKPATAQDNSSADTNKTDIKTVDVNSAELSAADLAKRQIFFDYDSDAIRAEYKDLIADHGKYLTAHPQAKLVLQGNTDERGTHEYNLALGQRRAVAVKKALNLQGINDSQIETVSYGEERAKQGCEDEECFQHDRRVDVVYQGQ